MVSCLRTRREIKLLCSSIVLLLHSHIVELRASVYDFFGMFIVYAYFRKKAFLGSLVVGSLVHFYLDFSGVIIFLKLLLF